MSDQSLCTACGMCCDGTLFGHVRLAPDDFAKAADAGLMVVSLKDGRGFLQPCPQLECGACAIYEERPGPCRRYRCTTLIALDEGSLELDTGLARIAQTHAAIGSLRRLFAEEHTVPEIRRLVASAGRDAPSAQIMAIAVLEILLDRYFRRSDRKLFEPDQAATSALP